MKTLELIKQARKCIDVFEECNGCRFKNAEGDCRDALINALADGYEMAYQDIDINCSTCIHYPCNHRGDCFNNEYKGWQWRGDTK